MQASGPSGGKVAPLGYDVLWVIDSGGLPCQLASTVSVGSSLVFSLGV